MSAFEIHVTVSCPELLEAARLFASALGGSKPPAAEAAPASVTVPAPSANPTPAGNFSSSTSTPTNSPFNPAMPTAPASISPSPTPAAQPTAVPLAPPPSFTVEQVSKAGAEFITAQPGKMPELMALLGQYGVQTVNALRPEHLGSFATALRGMGAKI